MATVVKREPQKPTGRDEILDAVLDAAEQLMAAEGPDVSLRTIAEAAGVSYSLVHRHIGTKDELVERLLRRYAERWMASLADDPDLGHALDRLLGEAGDGAGAYLRLLGWTMLSDADAGADAHRRHARLLPLTALADGSTAETSSVETRTDVAMALALIFGWRFFQPYLVAAMGLDEAAPDDLHAAVQARMRALATPPLG